MNILSHRGYWKTQEERNTAVAFERSFRLGYGTETDVRDCAGTLVISHDMPTGSEMPFEEFLKLFCQYDNRLPLALNVKADGIAVKMVELLRRHGVANWFTFDMSVPDYRSQLSLGVPAYGRLSEYEGWTPLTERSKGVWLDAFEHEWYRMSEISDWLARGKHVCIVSPELHKRAHLKLWAALKSTSLPQHPDLQLCTDLPEDAREFFFG